MVEIDCNFLISRHYDVIKRFSSNGTSIISYDIMQAANAYLGIGTTDRITKEQLDAITLFYNLDCALPSEVELPDADIEPPDADIGPPVAEAGMGGILMLGLGIGILYFMMKSKK